MNTPKLPLRPGQPYEGGFFGGQIMIDGTLHNVVWAPKSSQVRAQLLPVGKSWGGRDPANSLANTQALADAGSTVARQALDANISGMTGWSIPSADVLELGYRLLKPTSRETDAGWRDGENHSSVPPGENYNWEPPEQTPVEAFREGGAEAFDDDWYWSSTEYAPARAWIQFFHYGTQYDDHVSFEARVRFVRLIPA